jgi:hypothetical protein
MRKYSNQELMDRMTENIKKLKANRFMRKFGHISAFSKMGSGVGIDIPYIASKSLLLNFKM